MYDTDDWFKGSKESYLVLPRSVMQSMPKKWQAEMVELLKDVESTGIKLPDYDVSAKVNGRYVKDEFKDYSNGRNVFKGK
jgi:hypothetical protein